MPTLEEIKNYQGHSERINMQIITFCSLNYQKCLDLFVKTWQGAVIVYTDSAKLEVPEGVEKKVITAETQDWNMNTFNKIKAIRQHLQDAKEDSAFLFLDVDCQMRGDVSEVFDEFPNHDVICTRMTSRQKNNADVNSGVIFFRVNERVKKLCKDWQALALQYQKDEVKLPEQTAFSNLCYEGFDKLRDLRVAGVSEMVYNSENDRCKDFGQQIEQYKPKIVHFKAGLWKALS